jgi:hypothetical protein
MKAEQMIKVTRIIQSAIFGFDDMKTQVQPTT